MVCFKISTVIFVCFLATTTGRRLEIKAKRQVPAVDEKQDHASAQTGLSAAVHGGSKHFQYIHVPSKDHFEHGHRRGNEHHFTERHEKSNPHAGEFKTKVRWGDKHGGYGEHYWDFNHAGHGDDGSHESRNEEYTAYDEEESQQVPVVTAERQKRAKEDVEFINDEAKSAYADGTMQKHGGNYKKAKDYREKREKNKAGLFYNPESGKYYKKKVKEYFNDSDDFFV